MKEKFEIGDYVCAQDWCYGTIVYIHGDYVEIDFNTSHGGGSLTFLLKDLVHIKKEGRV